MQRLVDFTTALIAVVAMSIVELSIYAVIGYVLVTAYIEQDWPVFVIGVVAALIVSSFTFVFLFKMRRQSLS